MNTTPTATQAIQSILAPAVMVSASALFLLGLNARYVAILSRIQSLSDENRKLMAQQIEHRECSLLDKARFFSIERQLNVLLRSAWYLHNSIICQILAAVLFVLTSCAIGLNFLVTAPLMLATSLFLFITGLLLILAGIVFLGVDILISYPVILVEVKNEQAPY